MFYWHLKCLASFPSITCQVCYVDCFIPWSRRTQEAYVENAYSANGKESFPNEKTSKEYPEWPIAMFKNEWWKEKQRNKKWIMRKTMKSFKCLNKERKCVRRLNIWNEIQMWYIRNLQVFILYHLKKAELRNRNLVNCVLPWIHFF